MARSRNTPAPDRTSRSPLATSVLVTIACAAMYVALAAPVAGDKDSGEFTLVLAGYGLAHPTGYPLYTLAGGAFVHALHAMGVEWARAANLFSALGGAVAMGALYALTTRLLEAAGRRRDGWAFALLPVAAMAANPVWTQETTLAEVNSWHVAWCLLAALAALRVGREFAAGDATRARLSGAAALWGFTCGAGLAHHATSVLVAMPLSLALLVVANRHGRVGVVPFAAFVAGALPPLATLGWIAWRAWHPAAAQWPVLDASWPAVWAHLGGAQFRGFLGRFAPSAVQSQRLAQWVWPWLAPAVVGAFLAGRAPASPTTAVRLAIGAAAVLSCGHAFLYGVSDPSPYFLPAIALGLALLAGGTGGMLASRSGSHAGAVAVLALLLVATVPQLGVARARNDAYTELDALLRRMWAAIPPGPGFVVWDDDMASRLRGLQQLEGARRDLVVVQPRMLTHAAPRRRFAAAYGVDPLARLPRETFAGADPNDRAFVTRVVDTITHTIDAATALPVYEFRPDVPSLRRLTKPGDASAAAAPRP